ncbi:MAG: single-stranded-DNA-specific exonuclease RecJ [Candidatus Omnitrophica bacterium]|nr:single-stranded-DNA-specific exonuclease RecJ [Candidatus Omnitrophota bacterium]
MKKRMWHILKPDESLQKRLVAECGITPITAQLLINRNISDPREADLFLNSNLDRLHDPFLFKDMEKSVKRIKKAISQGEKIMIYGDYDVDGISGAALLERVLKDIGAHSVTYIPSRIDEGYGLNKGAVKSAHRNGVSLLITVDCGISGKSEIEYLKKLGIPTIVTDHHKINANSFPLDAYGVINPLQEDCHYPFKQLAGVGLAYKLAEAVTKDLSYDMIQHLDLVCLGTIQDMVPQLGENRIFTKHGLEAVNNTRKEGIIALIEASGLKNRTISTREVGYMLGPRINAAGRVSSAKIALNLLTTNDKCEARELAARLDRENRNRQRIENLILKEAIDRVENEVNFKDEKVIVLEGDDWHPGVIGIVASRVAERFNRPAIMIAFDEEEGRGSGRSIKNFHLFEALNECSDVLSDFGGHAAACGLTIPRKNLDEFRLRLNSVAQQFHMAEEIAPGIDIDMEIPLKMLGNRLIVELDELSPFGPGNPRPILASRDLKLKSRPRVMRRDGIKMWVTDGNVTCEAIGFGMIDMIEDIIESESVDIAYTPSFNTWQGLSTLQLELVDIQAHWI